MYRNFGRDNPAADMEDYEVALERKRKDRVVRCNARLWLTVEHCTEDEALTAAYERFSEMFRGADDTDFECVEE